MPDILLIVDMQQGSFTPETPRYDAEGLTKRLNRLAERVRATEGHAVFIQHEAGAGDPFHRDAPGWRLLPALVTRETDGFIGKRSCDAFLGTGLEAFIEQRPFDRLIITGCATDYCVDTTVRAALGRGYPTVVPSDGHTTAERPHLSAVKIIEHHNAIWADFIAPNGPAIICPSSALM